MVHKLIGKRILPELLLVVVLSGLVLCQPPARVSASPASPATPPSPETLPASADNEADSPLTGPNMSASEGSDSPAMRLFFPSIPRLWTLYFPIALTVRARIVNASPASGAVEQSPNVNLAWQVQPDDIAISHFRIYLEADDTTPDVLLAETEATYLDPPTLALDSDYYWQVVAIDQEGYESAGPIWMFRTESPFDPSKLGTMVTVPAGEFLMGCDESNAQRPFHCYDSEKPLHPVYLEAYTIDKYEVTNRQYQTCVEAGTCEPPRLNESYGRDWYFTNPAFDHYPVLYVSWWDANDYCAWTGKRLPTEAEWEKAARGAVDTRAWPWGHERIDCTRANFTDDSDYGNWHQCLGDTMPAGSHPAGASSYGAMDMSGNVFEWVADAWSTDYYHDSPYYNPTGPRANTEVGAFTLFVVRGGSYRPRWFYPQTNHRKAGHHGDAPAYRNDQVGFRCARSEE